MKAETDGGKVQWALRHPQDGTLVQIALDGSVGVDWDYVERLSHSPIKDPSWAIAVMLKAVRKDKWHNLKA